jgi:hypothetical protein
VPRTTPLGDEARRQMSVALDEAETDNLPVPRQRQSPQPRSPNYVQKRMGRRAASGQELNGKATGSETASRSDRRSRILKPACPANPTPTYECGLRSMVTTPKPVTVRHILSAGVLSGP